MNKKELRAQIKQAKLKLSNETIESWSHLIFQQLMASYSLREYDAVYVYVAFNEEVQTQEILDYAFEHKIRVAVPKIADGEMEFYYIQSMNDLSTGYYGILEPVTTTKAQDENVLMLMPGLAFDLHGNRVGYGAGYYDRYLMRKKTCKFTKIALAYDFQMVDNIENNEHDVQVDAIITTTRLIHRRD